MFQWKNLENHFGGLDVFQIRKQATANIRRAGDCPDVSQVFFTLDPPVECSSRMDFQGLGSQLLDVCIPETVAGLALKTAAFFLFGWFAQ